TNADPIVLGHFVKQVDPLVNELVPRVAFAVIERHIAVRSPFLEESCSAVLPAEVGRQSLFKAAAKDHGSADILFLPAIEVAVPVAARAAEKLADLRVAID